MKITKCFGLLAGAFLMASCSLIGREAGYPGGNLGYAADRKILFAQGHDQRVQRYLVTLAILAPLISETASTPIEAKLSAERIDAMYGKMAILKVAADRCRLSHVDQSTSGNEANFVKLDLMNCTIEDVGLSESALSFESVSFDVAKSLNDSLKQAYDNLNIRRRISNVTALSPSGILRTVLRARHLLPIAMKYFATYRDVTAILSASVLQSCVRENKAFDDAKKEDQESVWHLRQQCEATGLLVSNYLRRHKTDDLNLARAERPIREIYQSSQDVIHLGLNWQFSNKHAAALIYHVDRACLRLSNLQKNEFADADIKDCRLSKSKNAKEFWGKYKGVQ